MKASACVAVTLWLGLVPLGQLWGQQAQQSPRVSHCSTPNADPDRFYPEIQLRGHLKEIFEVCGCEYISGMTCRIYYNGARPLPSQVFFSEYDDKGARAGREVRLIYPRLKPGETGYATFRTRGSSIVRISLRGEWKGAWRNPY